MRTLVLSDLHLGVEAKRGIFAGGEHLVSLLESYSQAPYRLLLLGDVFDFLLDEEPLRLDPFQARQQLGHMLANPAVAGLLQAMGRLLARGGEVIIRLGNHDVELALSTVQLAVRKALGQPAEVARRLVFQRGEQPWVLREGALNLVFTHGEHSDDWNRVDYPHLPGPGGPRRVSPRDFEYSPGSKLVKSVLNPLKYQHGMRFLDLLKPDFQGAVLTALAVEPLAARRAFKQAGFNIAWQLFRRGGGLSFLGGAEAERDLGLAERLAQVDLSPDEARALEDLLAPVSGLTCLGGGDGSAFSARVKLARAGLRLYAQAQRRLVGDAGERFYSLDPTADELQEVRALAQRHRAAAVVMGHTHAARWWRSDGLLYANTGTWIWLMRLPARDAALEDWTRFLQEIKRDPGLGSVDAPVLESRLTALSIEPDARGVQMRLLRWTSGHRMETLRKGRIGDG